MTSPRLNNPHDHFFRHSFSDPAISQPFFQRYLPPDIRNRLDLNTLKAEPDSCIDPQLAEHRADILFSVQRTDGGAARLFLLLEHKSYDTPWAGLQLLDYLLRIWTREQTRLSKPPLPLVIGLVLYHGDTAWSGGQRFGPLVDTPAGLEDFTPDFRFLLCDLNQEQLDNLQQRAKMAIALQVLKFIHRDELPARLPEIMALFGQLAEQRDDALAYLGTVLHYIVRVARQVDRPTLEEAVRTALPTTMGEDAMSTIAESWIEEGKQENRIHTLQRLLEKRFGPQPPSLQERLAAASAEQLEAWTLRILDAASVEEVLQTSPDD